MDKSKFKATKMDNVVDVKMTDSDKDIENLANFIRSKDKATGQMLGLGYAS